MKEETKQAQELRESTGRRIRALWLGHSLHDLDNRYEHFLYRPSSEVLTNIWPNQLMQRVLTHLQAGNGSCQAKQEAALLFKKQNKIF